MTLRILAAVALTACAATAATAAETPAHASFDPVLAGYATTVIRNTLAPGDFQPAKPLARVSMQDAPQAEERQALAKGPLLPGVALPAR
ncbi:MULTISPECIES: hypothetical protein [Stenotrophomonas]|uniref:hypothetical protein n=1 Tax=Stenotrophomonas TaxID=40323 RepID=UPI000B019D7D|nr:MULTISPECIES: hypothetical protein [Stenotrophomonas]